MDTSLFKRMGVHGGRIENEHLYGMPAKWKGESGRDRTYSDKTCIEHGTMKNKPNMKYYAKGGRVGDESGLCYGGNYSEGGDICAEKGRPNKSRKKLAVGAVAKIRKGQY
jgi:hypothetical protein